MRSPKPLVRLVQLPIPQAAALAPTGNVPLAAGSLAIAAKVHGLLGRVDLEVVPPAITDSYGDERLADHVARGEPALVGLSLYLWNSERSLHLAREVKRRSPRTVVVVGGPEVGPDNPFVLGQDGFDVAVTGEAEDTFAALLAAYLDGRDPTGLPGVAVRGPRGLSPFGPAPTADFPLETYPSPYLEGLLPVEPARSTYVETVRGCRSHCTFCFYPRSSNVLRALDPSRAADLVARLGALGAREIVFLDPTFNHRPGFVDLCDALAAANPRRDLSLFAEVRAEGLTQYHASRLARAGFYKLEIGLQSVNRAALRATRRGGSPELVATAANLLHAQGIRLLVDLIVGLPEDRPEDVRRGFDWLFEHGLADEAQVFPLAVLPGTAMRADAARLGLAYDPDPPYLIRRTPTLDEAALRLLLTEAEERLGRLGEAPRPHLVEGEGADPPDVFQLDLDSPAEAQLRLPGARHVALWIEGRDLFASRDRALAAVRARLGVDPYATLDVVLRPGEPFPIDLLDAIRRVLGEGTPSYASRVLSWRGEDAQRRIAVALPRAGLFPADWERAVCKVVPVFVDRSPEETAALAGKLGAEQPGARVVGPWPEDGERLWRALASRAEPEAVAFASRRLEARWVREVLGRSDLGE
jgi:radical SAM superfamily enzyme YgiQ (UPF0313 family)